MSPGDALANIFFSPEGLEEVLAALITKCASIELDGDVIRRNRMALRGFEAVPVRIVGR